MLSSIILLNALGETINLMTLGGLALAVGILVDDATVTIENINRHLEEGSSVEHAILEGSQQIPVPALVSTLAICIVFVPMFLLAGVSRYLFVPMAEAVVFAMLTSVRAVANADPDAGEVLAAHACGGAGSGRQEPERLAAFPEALRSALREHTASIITVALGKRAGAR